MHPSLSAAALRHLPLSLRKAASVALGGTPADFQKMVGEAIEVPASMWELLLPVFYAHLNPIKAQQLQQRDSEVLGPADTELVVLAFLAVQGLSAIHEIPGGACPDLWPGLWQWSQLITKYNYCLPGSVIKHSREGPILAFVVLGRIYKSCDDDCAKIIAAEPGIRVTVAKVWALLSRKNGWTPSLQVDAYDVVLHFLRFGMNIQNRQHHDDLVEGSGGNLMHQPCTHFR
ncbi:hypothetical protein FB45DRAFT_941391 [Roridomyces roridus]|uniref:Uncharacterized protein n=1 Tax=Roridomyces roridus TaxID=1738132 RepID=A0AAD7B679_9AGAR|nr:hypothetical protein FB45DRAFT_941391 [Roridomyces roridus]